MLRASTGRGQVVRFLGPFLALLLAAGVPGPGLYAFASESTTPESGAAALSVASDPAGAAVYVNGKLEGETPVTVNGVAPGEHRVRLVKDGYLENSRLVSVKRGQGEAVQVKMTPVTGEARHAVQQDPDIGGGGGSKKALWIGLGVVAVGAGAYFLLKGGNEAPTPGTISVAPTGTGMAGTTSFAFTSQASDPDGDALTLNWTFGDGATGTGQTVNHTYTNPGTFQVALNVSDGKKSATANANVTVARNMAGTWTGGSFPQIPATVSLQLTQNGGGLGGQLVFAGGLTGNVPLTNSSVNPLSYPANVTVSTVPFTVTGLPGSFSVRFSGTTDGNGSSMAGTLTFQGTNIPPQQTTFRR